MNEREWLTDNDPLRMLHILTGYGASNQPATGFRHINKDILPRKLRLFAVACCRKVWHKLTDERSRKAVEVAEKYADGNATEDQLRVAYITVDPRLPAAYCCSLSNTFVTDTILSIGGMLAATGDTLSDTQVCDILREIIGNPYRPMTLPKTSPLIPIGPFDTDVGTITMGYGDEECPWLTPTVLDLARMAYEDRPGTACGHCYGSGKGIPSEISGPPRFKSTAKDCKHCNGSGRNDDGSLDPVRLKILADALEDAGCDNAEMLEHLREIRYHVRGCWVLDMLLGKS